MFLKQPLLSYTNKADNYLFAGLLCVILLLCCSKSVLSQNPETRQHAGTADTSQILQTIKKGQDLIKTRPNDALVYLTNAYQSSRTIHFAFGQALAATKMGVWYFGNNVNEAIVLGHEALRLFEEMQVGKMEDKAEAHLLLAESYDEKGKRDSSAYFYYLLNREIENGTIQDPELAISFYTKLTIFWINLNYDLTASEEHLHTIRSYVEKASQVSHKIKDSADAISSVLFLQGAYHHGLKQYDSARLYYTAYLQQREKLQRLSLPRKISTLTNITDTYLKEEKPKEALRFIAQIQQLGNIPEQSKFLIFYIAFSNLMKAKALYQLKNYQSSIELAEQTLQKLKSTGDHLRDEVLEAYQILADSYEAQGNFQKALYNKNIYVQLSDSLNKKEKVEIVHRQEIRYRMAEKDKELAEQHLTISGVQSTIRQRNLVIGGILLLLVFAVALFELWRRKNKQKHKLQKASIDNLQRKIEIDRLSATIAGEEKERGRIAQELHDGVGGLLSAAKMNLELANQQADETTQIKLQESIRLMQEASTELRKTAHNMMPALLLEEGLPDAICRFCENIGSKSPTQFVCQTLGNIRKLEPSFELPVYRMIQELIHNIVKHAKATHALIQVDFTEDNGLNITVEDDGIGLPENDGTNYRGIGLKSIASRVKSLNGKLYIESVANKGTSIYIEFENTQTQYPVS